MKKETYKKITDFLGDNTYCVNILKIANRVLTLLVYCLYPVFLLSLVYQQDVRLWRVFFVPGISFILVSIFRKKFNAARPYEALDLVPLLDKDTKGKSFPSRHVFSVFVIAMSFYYIYPLPGIGLMFAGFLLAIVRVITGVHFARDVIGGALIGVLSGLIGFYLF